MGLPGAGKTTLASKLVPLINAKWLNADKVRKEANDWDFSESGRRRQAERMKKLGDESRKTYAICDFICPKKDYRNIINPKYTIWMDTIAKGRYEDTNEIQMKYEWLCEYFFKGIFA